MTLIEARVRERTTEEWLARLHAAGRARRADPGRGPRARRSAGCATAAWWWSSRHPSHGALSTLGTPIKVDGALEAPLHRPRGWASTRTPCCVIC